MIFNYLKLPPSVINYLGNILYNNEIEFKCNALARPKVIGKVEAKACSIDCCRDTKNTSVLNIIN